LIASVVSRAVPRCAGHGRKSGRRNTGRSDLAQRSLPHRWDVFAEQDSVLIKDVDGTPSDGYGRVFHDWMTGTAWQ
jgi:hypothetical protein